MKSLRSLSPYPFAFALLAVLLGSGLACDSGNPLAPAGTFLTITASPSRIGLNGTATITVTGRRPDGNPLAGGTEIRFSVSLGSIEPIAKTDGQGVARAVFQADGRAGTAEVTATVTSSGSSGGGGGGGDGESGGGTSGGVTSATVSVVVGESAETAPKVTVSVNPDNIPVGDNSFSTVTVVVRQVDNSPAGAGIPVTLTTNLGTLRPTQTSTNSGGIATSRLSAGLQDGTATITAFVGAAEPATTTLTIRDAAVAISLQPSRSSINRETSNIELLAFVSNSRGLQLIGQPVTFESDLGGFADNNNVDFTDQSGQAQVTLTVPQGEIPANLPNFEVRAKTPSGTGELLIARETIVIN